MIEVYDARRRTMQVPSVVGRPIGRDVLAEMGSPG